MKVRKSDFDVSTDDLMFKEEVPEGDLYSKVNVDDRIFEDKAVRKKRTTYLIVLAIILIICSILCAIFGFIYLDKQLKDRINNPVVEKYDLFVGHSNSTYGGEISSFAKYNSENSAFSYNFYVSNNNPVDLDYSILLANLDYDNSKIDMTLIQYSLLKDNEVVKTGYLEDEKDNLLYEDTIKSNFTDNYTVKLWSDKLSKNNKFNFKINIGV